MPSQSIYSLKNIGLPALSTPEDFAHATRLSLGKIQFLSFASDSLYKIYSLNKINGGVRVIAQPSRELKALQSWILRNILDKLLSSPYSTGFERGSSILDNAKPHVGSNYILTIDLENFFPSIKAAKVYGVFRSIGYNKEMATLLTNLCTYSGRLPQGAPTSPKLANLICSKLDSRIQGYAGPKGITYTRYADDMTFSAHTATKIQRTKEFINTIVSGEDLTINKFKTKVYGTKRQKKVTGLVLSRNSVGIGREKLREIRSQLHHIYTEKKNNYSSVNGTLSYVYSVDKKAYKKLYTYIETLKAKYPDFSAKGLINCQIVKS
jgi:RNA-directed DNA polymerase